MEDESVFGLDNDLQKTISFYYIVQIVDNTVQNTALSVDDYMDKIKGVFNSYLRS